jgi:uncharacterized protein YdhG (YjbR/CyaY superfamily)
MAKSTPSSSPANGTAATVDEYLKKLPEKIHNTLEKLRQIIKTEAPKAEEVISYRIPTYKYLGTLVHFAAFENHCSLVVVNKSIIDGLKDELRAYKTTGTTIHFSPEKPLPDALVRKIVRLRINDNEENKVKAKAKSV